MLDWLKQRVISWLLSRTVGKWIAIQRHNLKAEAGTNEWTLVASDLAVQPDCLDSYDVPFRVKYGAVKKLTVIWGRDKVIKILIDSVSVVLESCTDHRLTPEAKKRAENAVKQQMLEQWESRLNDNLQQHARLLQNSGSEEEPPAYRAFLDKLEVSISTIDFVYHDASGTLGGHIGSVHLQNLAPSLTDPPEHTIKSAKLEGFFMFIDVSAASQAAAQLSRRGDALLIPSHCYLLHPCSAAVRLGYDKPKTPCDVTRPVSLHHQKRGVRVSAVDKKVNSDVLQTHTQHTQRIYLLATIPSLALQLKREQLLCAVKVADLFDNRRRETLSRPGKMQ